MHVELPAHLRSYDATLALKAQTANIHFEAFTQIEVIRWSYCADLISGVPIDR